MDKATMLAIRAVVSGLRYSQRINDADCEAIAAALDEVGTLAKERHPGPAAGELDALAADIARDSFGADHPIALAALKKSRTE